MSLHNKMNATGIYNIGNTCYMNTALQCLGNLSSFITIINKIKAEPPSPLLLCQELVKFYAASPTATPRNPIDLARVLQGKCKSINIREQNDVAEFISLFLDAINRELATDQRALLEKRIAAITYEKTTYDRQRQRMDLEWMKQVGKEYSPVVDAFYGQHISQIECAHCRKLLHNYEVFQAIILPLSSANISLTHLLEAYFKDRKLNEWKCDKCGQSGAQSVQSIALWRNPPILTITLQRFDVSQSINKNDIPVEIPLDLDLSQFSLGKTHKKYVLKSVAFHSGSYFGGHYHCVCRTGDSSFVLCDDEMTYQMNKMPDLSRGYVFFYEALG